MKKGLKNSIWKRIKITSPIHPFLFAVFPILFFVSNNIRELFINVMFLPLAFAVITALLLLIAINFLLNNQNKSSIITSGFILLFFSYGHVRNLIGDINYDIWNISLGTDKGLFTIWIIVFVLLSITVIKTRRKLNISTKLLNFISIILLVFPLINIISFELKTSTFGGSRTTSTSVANDLSGGLKKPNNPPDVYYLIFDRYASNTTLENYYKFNNKEFLDYLNSKGFYIASESRSNYPRTFLSLGSSLNMEYVNYLSGEIGQNSDDEAAAYYLLQNYKVSQHLKNIGYKYIHIGAWWTPTRKDVNADLNFYYSPLKFKNFNLDEFSTKLLETTILSPILSFFTETTSNEPLHGRDNHRKTILYEFEKLTEVANKISGPKYVFAHFLIPHGPRVLDSNCNPITKKVAVKNGDPKGYINQLECVNKKIKNVVELIFHTSGKNVIIVLQADEGPDPIVHNFSKKWYKSSIDTLREKTGILNAYYLPENKQALLYPSITPVNTFRLIFNQYFGTEYKLLDDKIFMIENKKQPYKFYEITDKL